MNAQTSVLNHTAGDSISEVNKEFYESLWSQTEVTSPEQFNTWPLIRSLLKPGDLALEIGPGLRPRIPVKGNYFVDLSNAANQTLCRLGGNASKETLTQLPYADNSFKVICAFDVIEHLPEDTPVLQELTRVLHPQGALIMSVPVHPDAWSKFDELVGHYRRYDASALPALLSKVGLEVKQSAGFGMKPQSKMLTGLGLWWLAKFPGIALHYYNKYFFPFALKRQETLEFEKGMSDVSQREGIILVATPGQ